MHVNVLDLLFALLSTMFTACAIEKELGTLRYMWRFCLLGSMTLLVFTIVCALTGIQQVSGGLWPVMFLDLVYVCMKNPDQIRE